MAKDDDGKPTSKPQRGTWPAIVEENVWRKAHRKLKDPARRNGGSRERKHLLSGLARCGPCGTPLASTRNSRKVYQYVCRNPECLRIARGAGNLDDLVTERVVWRLSRPDAVELLESDEEEVDTETLREQRQALNDRLVQLGKDFANAPPEFTQAALAEINEQLEAVNAVLNAPAKADIYEGVIGAKDVRKAFTGLDLGRRRTIIDALMTITVNPAKGTKIFDPTAIDLPWRIPVEEGNNT